MSVTLLIGSQWGDEGKGKIIDFLAQKSHFVIRFHGGNNAGHTVINKHGKFPLHLIPSGIFSKATALITNGTVLDLQVLVDEITLLQKAKIPLKGKLFISPRCHIIMPYHKILESVYEKAKGAKKIGSTGRGIGPVYADKVSYNGIRLIDLQNKKQFSEKLSVQLKVKNAIIAAFKEKPLDQKVIERDLLTLYKKIAPYVKEPFPLIHTALREKKHILLEGAQGMFLDNDWGTYPFVTASTVVSGGATAFAAIPPQNITDVVGVTKAYTTRVGSGPFPTELQDKTGDQLRKEGGEFGTTTGRVRRCGWFDAELIRFAASINGYTALAITKLDVLDFFDEIKICTGYRLHGKKVSYWELDATQLAMVEPIYKTLKGWHTSTKGMTQFATLPLLAKQYIRELEKQVGVKAAYISTGPQREETIIR